MAHTLHPPFSAGDAVTQAAALPPPCTSCPTCRTPLDAAGRCPSCTPAALARKFLPLAFWVAHRVWKRGGPVRRLGEREDAEQVTALLLMRAARLYRPTKGAKFSTYAIRVIALELRNAGAEGGLVGVPRGLAWIGEDGQPVAPSMRRGYGGCLRQGRAALVPPVGLPGRNMPGELLAGRTPDPADEVADRDERAVMGERVRAAVRALPGNLRQVIEQRFGLDGQARTLTEVGEVLGVTRERVRQIEEVALVKLYKRLRAERKPVHA